MKHTITAGLLTLFIVAAGIAAAAPARASQSDPLTGTWNCTSHGGSHDGMKFTLRLHQNGEMVTGSVASPIGDTRISGASFRENKLHVRINGAQGTYVLTATYSQGRLTGNWEEMRSQQKGTWEGSKGSE